MGGVGGRGVSTMYCIMQVSMCGRGAIYIYIYIYDVVNFSSQVIFVFLSFWGMVMYANEVETKEK